MIGFESMPFHPLAQPIERLLGAIERFDETTESARQIRCAMQYLLSVAQTDGSFGSADAIAVVRPLAFAKTFRADVLADIHSGLQISML